MRQFCGVYTSLAEDIKGHARRNNCVDNGPAHRRPWETKTIKQHAQTPTKRCYGRTCFFFPQPLPATTLTHREPKSRFLPPGWLAVRSSSKRLRPSVGVESCLAVERRRTPAPCVLHVEVTMDHGTIEPRFIWREFVAQGRV